jgi:hypothetical protein
MSICHVGGCSFNFGAHLFFMIFDDDDDTLCYTLALSRNSCDACLVYCVWCCIIAICHAVCGMLSDFILMIS